MPAFIPLFIAAVVAFFAEKGAAILFRIGVFVAFLAVFITFIALFSSGVIALFDSFAVSVPAVVNDVWGWFMPSNTGACLTAVISARFLKFALDFKFKIAMLKARLTAG